MSAFHEIIKHYSTPSGRLVAKKPQCHLKSCTINDRLPTGNQDLY